MHFAERRGAGKMGLCIAVDIKRYRISCAFFEGEGDVE